MAKVERGLGKGLGSILGNVQTGGNFRSPVQYVNATVAGVTPAREGEVKLVRISDIEPNPYQPRVTFDEEALQELATSISALGLIQPITVRAAENGRFQIISGERRFRASKLAGLATIPAYIKSTDNLGMLEMAIVENVQRADLDPIETAMSYHRLIEECHLTQEQMADRIGKSRVAVTNFLRLLRLPAKVQYDLKVGNISVGHAKVLLGIEDKQRQEELSDVIISRGLSVRDLEALLKEEAKRSSEGWKVVKNNPVDKNLPDTFHGVADIVGRYFSNNVSFKRRTDGTGTMTVRFDNDQQMASFLEALTKSQI